MPHKISQSSVDIAVQCAYQCEHCEEACLGSMPECARLCRDCADICWLSAAFMSRGSRFSTQILRSCIDICEACASECEKHPDSPHCQKCADACRRAALEYRKIATVAGVA